MFSRLLEHVPRAMELRESQRVANLARKESGKRKIGSPNPMDAGKRRV